MAHEPDLHRVLRQMLERHGWSCRGVERVSRLQWQAQEIWEVASAWSPCGLRAWLALQWQYDYFLESASPSLGFAAHRPEDGQTWAFIAQTDLSLPVDRGAHGGKAAGRHWRTQLQPLFTRLDAWRNEHTFAAVLAEAQRSWTAADPWREPAKWLAPLRPCLSERKWRLFACACLRRLPEVQEDEESLHVVALAEQYADGHIRKRELRKARKTSRLSWLSSFDAYGETVAAMQRTALVIPPAQRYRLESVFCDLEPSHIPLRPSWLRRNGGLVASMAQIIYDRHSFADLPILADALEDAGCDNALLLHHCRHKPAEDHARGCWVLDHLLGWT